MMTEESEQVPGSLDWFLGLRWLLATAAAFLLSGVAVYAIEQTAGHIPEITVFFLPALLLGPLQWLALRRGLGVSAWWFLATAIAWCFLYDVSYDAIVRPFYSPRFLIIFVCGGILGLVQWLALVRRVQRAFWWILATALAWWLAFIAGGPDLPYFAWSFDLDAPLNWVRGFLAWAGVYGLCSALALVLLARKRKERGLLSWRTRVAGWWHRNVRQRWRTAGPTQRRRLVAAGAVLALLVVVGCVWASVATPLGGRQMLVQYVLGKRGFTDVDLSGANLNHGNLSGADMSRAFLRGGELVGADLTNANLSEADLREAHLTGAKLNGATLKGARLDKAVIQNAKLGGADLGGADLGGADLHLADLSGANLEGADLSEARLGWANLGAANLEAANLGGANLNRARLMHADLRGADLTDAVLTDANLTDANLTNANLSGANLSGAKLRGADLRGAALVGVILASADLTGAQMTDTQLIQAQSLKGAKMPDGSVHE